MTSLALPQGYRFSGIRCGIRPDPDRLDLALVVSDRPAAAAGVFTQNRVVAAPVKVCRERVPGAAARGIVVCSGNANACTGQRGLADARRMAAVAAEAVGCESAQMLVCSTGVIGQPLPMACIEPGIRTAAGQLAAGPEAFDRAAHAILTTDTRIKTAGRVFQVGGAEVRITGFAKGAAMIGPNLATMLAFVLTDAAVAPADLTAILRQAAYLTFNCISVEGHTSTNDTVLLLANGAAAPLQGEGLAKFARAVTEVCADLAVAIAGDAEGADHLVTIAVEGMKTEQDARKVARTVAESALVKTAIFGGDPNWGRIVSAAGYAGVPFEEEDLSLYVGDALLYRDGQPEPFEAAEVSRYLKNNRDITLRLQFKLGSSGCRFWTCDLTQEYVRLNADYTT